MLDKLYIFITNLRGTRRSWQGLLLGLDAAVIALSTALSYYARFEGVIPDVYSQWMGYFLIASVAVYCFFLWLFGLYRVVLRYVGIDTLFRTLGAIVSSVAIFVVADVVIANLVHVERPVPFGILFMQAVLVLITVAGIRVTVRAAQHVRVQNRHKGERLIIIGAGSAGSLLLRELFSRPELEVDVVGFLDDSKQVVGRTISGVPIIGTIDELEDVVATRNIQQVFVALPSADQEYVREILNRSAALGLSTRIMPKLVIEKGKVSLSDMRKVDVNDLLGRPLTPIDVNEVKETLQGKVVAVTGAAGSIGSELCRQIILMEPKELLLFEVDESRLYELWFELEAIAPGVAQMHILDIRDQLKVKKLFSEHRPHVVLHSAAYKHVPLMEAEPMEAMVTNVMGTKIVMDAAGENGAERFVLISTDKAVAPINVMGKTKQIGERLMLATAEKYPDMMCCAVRFGNVLASRGSVVPIFEDKLMRGEPLTVTHPEVSRYFMVIPEAARLVLQAQAIGKSKDIFVLEMGEPVKIVELARKMIALSGIPAEIVFTGLRPGEKLHEVLANEDEKLLKTEREMIYRVEYHSLEPFKDDEFTKLMNLIFSKEITIQDVLEV